MFEGAGEIVVSVSGRSRGLAFASVALLGCGLAGGGSSAQDAPARLGVELNRLEPQGESCRPYLLLDNSRGEELRSLKLDLFALDTDGVAQRRLAIELGPVPAHKTLIRIFDVPGLACARFGRVLINDIMSCEDAAGARPDCAARIDTRSRIAAVPFGQ